ncbi:MAG: hypothetical protein JSU63_01315 [Phycisphaerales bacterium]|nr:MAG: hypothetical protein JSU63_01315 [Phycisphaerales bacterium]
MKNGTVYAAKIKKAYNAFRQTVPTPEIPQAYDPLRQLGVGIVGVGGDDADAQGAIDRLLSTMVDWNEVRISSADEINRAMGNTIPDGEKHSQRMINALQAIFNNENKISLDRLKNLGRREARQYLEQINGVDDYAVASVILWSLGGHAIPVDDKTLEALRSVDLIHPSASRAEVQAFLERHVSAADAKEFCIVMRSFPRRSKAGRKRRKTRKTAKKETVRKSKSS